MNQTTATTASLELLNKVQAFLIDQANAKGINLAADFDGPEDFKKFVIGFAFKSLRDAGATVEEAYNAVMGDGAYSDLSGNLHAQFAA
jgi:hypothetical protein